MTVNSGHGCVKPRIRDAINTYTPICGNVRDQPVNGIVSICCLVGLLSALVRNVRPDVFELALTHETTADVLVNKNVSFARKQFVRSDLSFKLLGAVRTDGVRGAV